MYRWRTAAAQVHPPMSEEEMGNEIWKTLSPEYKQRLATCVGYSFSRMGEAIERIENELKASRNSDSSADKRASFHHKKESVVNAVSAPPAQPYRPGSSNFHSAPRFSAPPVQHGYYQTPPPPQAYQQAPAFPYTSQPYYPARQNYRPTAPQNYRQTPPPTNYRTQAPSAPRQFQPLPMSYTEIFQQLMAKAQITPLSAHPNPNTSKRSYNPNASCAYHSGQRGHAIESCFQFKTKVEELINSKLVEFTDERPNITTNPLPNHR